MILAPLLLPAPWRLTRASACLTLRRSTTSPTPLLTEPRPCPAGACHFELGAEIDLKPFRQQRFRMSDSVGESIYERMDPPTGISTRLAGFGVRLDSAPAGLPSRAIALDILGSTSGERGNYARSPKMSIGAEKTRKPLIRFRRAAEYPKNRQEIVTCVLCTLTSARKWLLPMLTRARKLRVVFS